MELQPCDWHEHDVKQQYVVDVYGRTQAGKVACVRVTGFKPMFYVGGEKFVEGGQRVKKYDVMAGFKEAQIEVWKVTCQNQSQFHDRIRKLEAEGRTLYESNLHPFLRLFHERHLGPGSPFKFAGVQIDIPEKDDEPQYDVDEMYTCHYATLEPSTSGIPLKVASYDLEMCPLEGSRFPMARIDPIVQVGVSFRWSNDLMTPIHRYVFVYGKVDPSDEPNTTFMGCKTEEDMLLAFRNCILDENPDIMCGYNTFGFDDAYIEDRCRVLGLFSQYEDSIMNLSRAPFAKKNAARQGDPPRFVNKFTDEKKFELASGKYDLRPLAIRGRLGIDLLLNMRREHSLESYKLDSVASVFLRDKVVSWTVKDEEIVIKTKSTRGMFVGTYVRFDVVGNTSDHYRDGEKFIVTALTPTSFSIEYVHELFEDLNDKDKKHLEWTFSKDDVEPHDLFRLHRGSPADRARIARYCIQDCDLVLNLMQRLDTIVNARGMADVCKVPMQYVLARGQGIKIYSAILYFASQRNQIIRTQASADDDQGYEGAVVISPKIGMYLDQPVSVLDFNSLYPTNMIAYNLSPDTLVQETTRTADGRVTVDGLSDEGVEALKARGYVLDTIKYDTKNEDVFVSETSCTFVQHQKEKPMTEGILPQTLATLLSKRKEFKTKMEDQQYDEAQRAVFNGLQMAYKVVANSMYGQTGSKTSPIRKLCVAACTTAAGRNALYFAKQVAESEFGGQVVYGDTDSIFIKFPTKSLEESIKMGIACGKSITSQMRKPYKIAYEKTFYPFILFCRKRYVGIKYEEDPNPAKGKRMSMGIVLKRRDNAPIVKDIFGGALDILLDTQNVRTAQDFVHTKIQRVLKGKEPLEKFIISKSLRDDYKNPKQIAHRVLADRMAERDPGTAPKVGDRVPYIYIVNPRATMQGERIEHADYVRHNGLEHDAKFYITNQIQNPVAQLFALCIERLEGYVEPRPSYKDIYTNQLRKFAGDEEQATLATLQYKEKQLDSMMFLGSPSHTNQSTLDSFWKRT